jgi:hypothetical protein
MHTRQRGKGGVSVAGDVSAVNAVFLDSSACTATVPQAVRLEASELERRPA